MARYNRILLKLSGEALMGEDEYGINADVLINYARQIREVHEIGLQIGIVIGGGNIFRGISGTQRGVDRVKGDYMGMLATVINGLAIQSAIENVGLQTSLLTAIKMEPVGSAYSPEKLKDSFAKGNVVIFSAGTGNPFFTTDTAAALRAVEMSADALLKGTRVDGVYTTDPEKDPEAKKYDTISFDEVIQNRLNVMDLTAFTMCRENNLPIIVFNMNQPGNLKKIIMGEKIGTLVSNKA